MDKDIRDITMDDIYEMMEDLENEEFFSEMTRSEDEDKREE